MRWKLPRVLRFFVIKVLIAAFAASTAIAGGQHSGGHDDTEWTAIGRPGKPSEATRTIEIGAYDTMRFNHDKFMVKRGETVRIVLRNTGKLPHELVLGDEKSLREHAALMRKFPGMEHDEPNQIRVAPGESQELVWQFTREGKVSYACLYPGHYEAGMKGAITVTTR